MFSPNNICLLLSLWLSILSYVLAAVPQALSEAFDTTFVLTPVFGTKNVVDGSNVAATDITTSPTFNLVGQFDSSTTFTIFLMDVTGFQDPTVQAKLIYLQSGFAASKNDDGILTSTIKTEVPYIAPTQAGRSIIALLFIEPVSGAKLNGFSSQGIFSVNRFRTANKFQLPDAGSSFTVTEGTGKSNNALPESEAPASLPAVRESSIVSVRSSRLQATATTSILPVSSIKETTTTPTTEILLPTTSEEVTSKETIPYTTTAQVSLPPAITSITNNHSLTKSKLLSSISSIFASTKSQTRVTSVHEPSATQPHSTSYTTLMTKSIISSSPHFVSSPSIRKPSTTTHSTSKESSIAPAIINAPAATNAAHRNKKIQEKAELIAGILLGILLDV